MTGGQLDLVSIDTSRTPSFGDIRHCRQIDSQGPGHHLVSGVEAITGPVGPGVAPR